MAQGARSDKDLSRELEQDIQGEISRPRMREDLEWFAHLGLRLGGTDAEQEAVRYVLEQLQVAGIECKEHEFNAFVSYADHPPAFGPAGVVVLTEPREEIVAKIYAFSGSTSPEGIPGDLVDVGIGSETDYARLRLDPRGRIALSELSFDCPHSEPARVAQERGAAGLIVSNWSDRDGPRIHTSTAKWTWGNPTPANLADGMAKIPVVAVSAPDSRRLRERLRLGPLRVAVVASASRRWVRASQPVADIRGRSEDFLLLHCHIDSFGRGVTDNATGVVGLLELARVLQKHRERLGRSLRFAWWACHEMPYDGSTWYLDAHWDEFRDRCIATLNADSWALAGSRNRLVGLAFAELEGLVESAIRDVVGQHELVGDFVAKEAEQSFWSIGIPSLFVFSATPDFPKGPITGTWFHTEFDTIDHVDDVALEQLVRTYGLITVRLATATVLPFSYFRVVQRLSALLEELRSLAPPELRIDDLAENVARLEEVARDAETVLKRTSVPQVNRRLMQIGRALNPVIYTVTGPYGQDPVAAGYLSRRLPGLRLCLEQLASSKDDDLAHLAWLTRAVRERNRVADAVAVAEGLLEAIAREDVR